MFRLNKWWKVAVLVIVLGIDIFWGSWLLLMTDAYNPIAHANCVWVKGDSYEFVPGWGARGFDCIHHYSDGGEECTGSDQCEGFCLATEETVVVPVENKKYWLGTNPARVVSGFGRCSETDPSISLCSQGTFENPTMSEICN